MFGEQPGRKVSGGAGQPQSRYESAVSALAARRVKCILGCIKNSIINPVITKRGDYSAVFSIGAASPWILCAVLSPTM